MSNILSMSDEDFLNQGAALEDKVDDQIQEEGAQSEQPQEETIPTEEQELGASGSDEFEGEQEEVEESGYPDLQEDSQEPLTEELDESPEEEQNAPEIASEELSEAGELKRILEPFRANGKDVQVHNADEAITLMQLGANYTKKMQELSPNLKVLKTLEKNELLDPNKLNHLIDLSKKDPKAIKQLLKESEYEPDGYGEEEDDVEYTPTNHQVSDKAVELEEVLTNMESTPTYDKCIDLVGNQWDAKSKQLLTQEPQLIASLNEQMRLGIFDKINEQVERAKMFGGLSGQSDFEAYKLVGAQMMQRGELKDPARAKPVAKTRVKPLDKALSKQRKAATTSKSSSKAQPKKEESFLAMSDEDFLKINNIKL